MESIFSNLHLYEIVFLFLGIFLFLILCVGLTYYIIKKTDIKRLLMFFPIPIIMIGYPSIKEIQIGDYKIALREYEERLLENPEDSIARENLQEVTKILERRATTSKDLQAVSVANLLLGNSEKVIDLTSKAIEKQKEDNSSVKSLPNEVGDNETAQVQKVNRSTLEGIRKLAILQNKIKIDSTAIKDTLLLKEQIQKIPWENPKTKTYLNTKITIQAKQKE